MGATIDIKTSFNQSLFSINSWRVGNMEQYNCECEREIAHEGFIATRLL
jgi:hypothetical protein